MRTLASSVSLFSRAQDAALKKKKTIDALKSQPNLLACYGTIENRLQGLFLACKTATAGMMSLNMTEQGDRRMTLVSSPPVHVQEGGLVVKNRQECMRREDVNARQWKASKSLQKQRAQ